MNEKLIDVLYLQLKWWEWLWNMRRKYYKQAFFRYEWLAWLLFSSEQLFRILKIEEVLNTE
jgi:hypothetical protein